MTARAHIATVPKLNHVNTGPARLDSQGDHVDFTAAARHKLAAAHLLDNANAIAIGGGPLVVEPVGGLLHAAGQIIDDLFVAAFKELNSCLHIGRVVLLADIAHARRAAAADLVLQAGPRAVGKNRVAALSEPEQAVDLVERLAHGPGAGKRAEIAVRRFGRAAIEADAWEVVIKLQPNPRIAFVVAQADVETRLPGLDPLVFKQQRLGFGARQADLHAGHPAHQQIEPRTKIAAAEIAGHPPAQVARLADIKHLA